MYRGVMSGGESAPLRTSTETVHGAQTMLRGESKGNATPSPTPGSHATPKPSPSGAVTPTQKPSAVPTKKPDHQPTETSKPNQPTALPTKTPTLSAPIKVGTKTTVGKMKYRVTKVNKNNIGEVVLAGTARKKSDKGFISLKLEIL